MHVKTFLSIEDGLFNESVYEVFGHLKSYIKSRESGTRLFVWFSDR